MTIAKFSVLNLLAAMVLFAQPQQGQPEFARRGMQLLRDGKLAEAEALYKAELAKTPDSSPANSAMGNLMDLLGKSGEAKRFFAKAIETAPTPAAKAAAQRSMAMSYAFDNDCANTVKYERMVYNYWVTEKNYYQQGEMLTEAARVCIEAGKFDEAEKLYKEGYEIGIHEPERLTLWKFRLEHALGRLAARRGDKAEAMKHVAAAKAVLDSDVEMAKQQAVFYPYLTGYVALFTGDAKTAVGDLEKANTADPFIQCLTAQAYEKLGEKDKAMELYKKAATTTAHNPPAAYAKWFTAKKL